ncbi:MAG: ribbon-helix-helix domain-containing protein [Kangiellaceae bacterium]|nr:ribbon-helix-helix domain-containing protein [Kangiellaceae bacterium]
MSGTLNLSLTDELKKFVQQHSGEGTLYSTPSEFIRDAIRERKERLEAANLRQGILEGFQDVIGGRTIEFKGDLRQVIAEAKSKEQKGW